MSETMYTAMRLQPYERHVACVLIAALLGLGIAGMRQGAGVSDGTLIATKVKVVGAVEPIEIAVSLGATVEEVIEKIHLAQEADLSEIDGMKKICPNQVLVIPFQGKKTFFVCGAVKESKIVVLEGEVTAKKVLDSIIVDETANVKAFLRRRVFPNGSVIEVKKKPEK